MHYVLQTSYLFANYIVYTRISVRRIFGLISSRRLGRMLHSLQERQVF